MTHRTRCSPQCPRCRRCRWRLRRTRWTTRACRPRTTKPGRRSSMPRARWPGPDPIPGRCTRGLAIQRVVHERRGVAVRVRRGQHVAHRVVGHGRRAGVRVVLAGDVAQQVVGGLRIVARGILSASQAEFEDAKCRCIELVTAVYTPAGPVLYVCAQAVVDTKPDVVIGHDLVSGSVAWTYARRYLSGAKFVLVVHTAHSQNEAYKRSGEAALRTESTSGNSGRLHSTRTSSRRSGQDSSGGRRRSWVMDSGAFRCCGSIPESTSHLVM